MKLDSKPKILITAAVGVIAAAFLIGGAVYWWYSNHDAPDEVNLDSAVEGLKTTTTGAGQSSVDGDSTRSTASAGDIAGKWTVDTKSGDFDFESATGTFVGFRIKEELAQIGSATAVGRTGDVIGSLSIVGNTVTAAEFTVDLSTITTNESRRDRKVQDALETSQFPDASFKLTDPIDLGADAADGSEVSATAKGELTIHGVTHEVSVHLDAKLVNDTIVVVGSVDISFGDYGVSVPSSPMVVSAEDHGTLELQILFTRQ